MDEDRKLREELAQVKVVLIMAVSTYAFTLREISDRAESVANSDAVADYIARDNFPVDEEFRRIVKCDLRQRMRILQDELAETKQVLLAYRTLLQQLQQARMKLSLFTKVDEDLAGLRLLIPNLD